MKPLTYAITSHNFHGREPLTIPFQTKKREKTKTEKKHEKVFYLGFTIYMYLLIFHFWGPMY